jgi:hypothetical protein
MNRQELKKQLDKLTKAEEGALIEEHIPYFEKYSGKCYRLEYDDGCKYAQIKKVTRKDVYVADLDNKKVSSSCCTWGFTKYEDGCFSVDPNEFDYIHSLNSEYEGYEEITKEEFNKAWEDAIKSLVELGGKDG